MFRFSRAATYYTLIGSLPALPRHFEESERVPISELRLKSRLKMLKPRDAEVIEEMTEFLAWERQPLELTDENVIQRYVRFMDRISDPFAQSLIQRTLTVRTVIAGLRCRRLDLEPPLGLSPVAGQIERNWHHPDFRLGGRFPWIRDVDELLTNDASFDLQRKVLDIAWQYVCRLAGQYHFNFEAVVLYLKRWEIVYRWTQRDAELGKQKFDQLVTEAMGPYAQMWNDASERDIDNN